MFEKPFQAFFFFPLALLLPPPFFLHFLSIAVPCMVQKGPLAPLRRRHASVLPGRTQGHPPCWHNGWVIYFPHFRPLSFFLPCRQPLAALSAPLGHRSVSPHLMLPSSSSSSPSFPRLLPLPTEVHRFLPNFILFLYDHDYLNVETLIKHVES